MKRRLLRLFVVTATCWLPVIHSGAQIPSTPGKPSEDRTPATGAATPAEPAPPPGDGGGRPFDPWQSLYRHNRAGNRAFAEGATDQALQEYAEAQGVAPHQPQVLYNLGNVLARRGQHEEALRAFTRAAETPEAPAGLVRDARFNEGLVRLQQHDVPGAVNAFGRALVQDPTDGEARRNLELALRMLQRQQQEQPSPSPQDQEGDSSAEQQDRQDQDRDGSGEQQQQQQPQGAQPQGQEEQEQPTPSPASEEETPDAEAEAAQRLLKALEGAEQEALRRALRQKLPDLPDREVDW